MVGVTDFAPTEPGEVEIAAHQPTPAQSPSPRLPGPDSHCPPLTPVRLEDLT